MAEVASTPHNADMEGNVDTPEVVVSKHIYTHFLMTNFHFLVIQLRTSQGKKDNGETSDGYSMCEEIRL